MANLTAKQLKFIDEYMKDLNATQAAIRAGYSPATAGVIGCENLKKPYIKQEIERRQAEVQRQHWLTVDFVLKALKRELSPKRVGSTAAARAKAAELLGKHIGMWPREIKVKGDPDQPVHVQHTHSGEITHVVDPGILAAFSADVAAAGLDGVLPDGTPKSLDTPPTPS